MLRDNFHPSVKIVHHGFLIDVEAEEDAPIDLVKLRLADACTWVDGVGTTDVEYMGIISEDGDIDDSK